MRRTRPDRPAAPAPRVRCRRARALLGSGALAAALAASLLAPPPSGAAAAPSPADPIVVTGEDGTTLTVVPPPLEVEVGEIVHAVVTISGTTQDGGVVVFTPGGERNYLNMNVEPDVPTLVRFDTRLADAAPQSLLAVVGDLRILESFPIDVRRLPVEVALTPLPGPVVERGERWSVDVGITGPPVYGADVANRGRWLYLERRGTRGWSVVDVRHTRAGGDVPLTLPPRWAGRHDLRLRATENTTHAGATVAVGTVTRTRSYRPRGGTQAAYAPTPDGLPARFQPCTLPVRGQSFALNARRGPAFAPSLARRALVDLEEASGLQFYADRGTGRTTIVPFAGGPRDFGGPAAPHLTVAWARASQVPGLRGRAFLARFQSSPQHRTPWRRISRAAVVLNADLAARPGFRTAQRWERILAHALGRAVGLGVVDDPRQVMSPPLAPAARRYDAHYAFGDLRGLRAVGASAGCLDDWRDATEVPALDPGA